jgi:hypothetical protein
MVIGNINVRFKNKKLIKISLVLNITGVVSFLKVNNKFIFGSPEEDVMSLLFYSDLGVLRDNNSKVISILDVSIVLTQWFKI